MATKPVQTNPSGDDAVEATRDDQVPDQRRSQGPDADRPPVREEYPGPQTTSTGKHIEPGDTEPTDQRRPTP